MKIRWHSMRAVRRLPHVMGGSASVHLNRPPLSTRVRDHLEKDAIAGWLLVAPSFIGWMIFIATPICAVIYFSFTHYTLGGSPHFAGVANYRTIFESPTLLHSITLTLYYSVLTVPALLVSGLLLALLMNKRGKLTSLLRVFYLIPWLSTPVILGIVWQWMLFPSGLIAAVLAKIGILAPAWLSSQRWAMIAVAGVTVWQYAGYNMLFYLAGLQGIPRELSEAMALDGVSAFQEFRWLTLPMVRPTTLFAFIVNVIATFTVFDLVYVMTAGGPGTSTSVLSYAAYQEAFTSFDEGLASALSVILFLMTLVVVLIQLAIYRKRITYRRY
jgi:multiple sugar transport system permease protein